MHWVQIPHCYHCLHFHSHYHDGCRIHLQVYFDLKSVYEKDKINCDN